MQVVIFINIKKKLVETLHILWLFFNVVFAKNISNKSNKEGFHGYPVGETSDSCLATRIGGSLQAVCGCA